MCSCSLPRSLCPLSLADLSGSLMTRKSSALGGILLAVLLLLLSSSVDASSSSKRHHARLQQVDATSLTDPTPFKPMTFSGSINASQSSGFVHFTLPSSSPYTQTLTPSFSGAGAILTLTSDALASQCSFAICTTRLVQAVEDVLEWRSALPTLGRSDVCEGYANFTVGTASPATLTAQLTPGVVHFAVYARTVSASSHQLKRSSRSHHRSLAEASLSADVPQCAFTLTLSGDACAAGSFGTPSGCTMVNASTSPSSAFVSQTLPASPADSTIYFEVHQSSVHAASLKINVSSSADNVTVFQHEGALPSVSGQPINPLADFNATSRWATGKLPQPYDAQAQLTLRAPSYRVQAQNQRYFLGVTRGNAPQSGSAPSDSEISVSVSERACNPGFAGAECEFRVTYLLDPFELSRTALATIPADMFSWNVEKTELWAHFALLFLNTGSNFSVGLQAMDGQLVPELRIRLGGIPTTTRFDARLSTINPAQSTRFYQSGSTLLHDAVWYVSIAVPRSYPQMGSVMLFVNQQCPGTITTQNADGTTTVQECNGHGKCMRDIHQCKCTDRWSGFDCLSVDTVSCHM